MVFECVAAVVGAEEDSHVLSFSHLAEINTELDEAVAVAPFVVVPSDDLDEVAIDNVGKLEIYDTRVAVAAVIDRDELFVGSGEDALIVIFGGSAAEDVVDFFDAGWAFADCGDV